MSKKNNAMTLSETAVLFRFHGGHPSGIKQDSFLKDDLASTKNADSNTLMVAKHIFGYDINKYFRKVLNEFRNDHYFPSTFPWKDGATIKSSWRLVANSDLDKLIQATQNAKTKWDREVQDFAKRYQQLLADAPNRLGSAYNPDDYDSLGYVMSKFIFEYEIMPIPSYDEDDIRLKGSAQQRQMIADSIKGQLESNIEAIAEGTIESLSQQMERVSDAMKNFNPSEKGGKFFKDAIIDNLAEANNRAIIANKDLFNNNKSLTEVTTKVAALVATINSVDSLRDKTELGQSKRDTVAEKIDDAQDTLKNASMLDQMFGGRDE